MIKDRQFSGHQTMGARSYQEDDFAFYLPDDPTRATEQLVAVLADGMGGEVGGAEASALAVETFLNHFAASTAAIPQRLAAALQAANQRIAAQVEHDPSLLGMGCTLVAVAVTPAGLYWINVGDSLLYLCRNGEIRRLNADHSLAGERSRRQQNEEDVPDSWQGQAANALLSALSGTPLTLIDQPATPLALAAGDCIVLASDGLLTLSPPAILAACAHGTAEEVSQRLIEAVLAQEKPGQDNTTVLTIFPPDAALEKSPPSPPNPSLRHWLWPVFLGILTGMAVTFLALIGRGDIPLLAPKIVEPVHSKTPPVPEKPVDAPPKPASGPTP